MKNPPKNATPSLFRRPTGAAGAAGGSAGAPGAAGATGDGTAGAGGFPGAAGAASEEGFAGSTSPASLPPPPPSLLDVGSPCVEAAQCAAGHCWGVGAPATCHAADQPQTVDCIGLPCSAGIEGCDLTCVNGTMQVICSSNGDCITNNVGQNCQPITPGSGTSVCK